jgi:hypothetical protein
MPKPLACYASVDGDQLLVEFRVPNRWRQSLAIASVRVEGGHHEWYRERYGPEYRNQVVLCVGRDEWALATFDEIADWERSYPSLGPGGCSGDDIAAIQDPDQQVPAAAVAAAAARGAVHVRWYEPAYRDDGISGRIWCTRYAGGEPKPPMCERCATRLSGYAVHWFEGTRPVRSLCQSCIDTELEISQFDMARDLDRRRAEFLRAERTMSRAELAELAEEEAMWWALRVTPPFIRDFILRYREGFNEGDRRSLPNDR